MTTGIKTRKRPKRVARPMAPVPAPAESAPPRRAVAVLPDPFLACERLSLQGGPTGPLRRKLIGISIALHVVLMAVGVALPLLIHTSEPEPDKIEIVFYAPELPEPTPPPPPPLPKPTPQARPEPEPAPPAPPKPEPRPVPRPEPPAPVEIARSPAPRPEPVPPVLPVPQVREEPKPAARPRPKVRNAGFGSVEVAAKEPIPARRELPAPTAGFAEPAVREEAPPGREVRVVAAGQFGNDETALPAPGKPQPRRVTAGPTAFDETADDAPAVATARAGGGAVQQGAFGSNEPAEPRPGRRDRVLPARQLDSPVEVISKPKPRYTDEARNLRIEGEVVLSVTFIASGRLEVHGVIDGLGHGLDQAAIEAAKKIQFTPARRDGRPVDHKATLRVVFRLA